MKRLVTVAAVALGLGLVLGYFGHKPAVEVKEVVKWKERTVTDWKTRTEYQLKYAGLPGSTVVIQPDGTVIIYGPANLTVTASTTGQGTTTHTGEGESHTATKPAVAWSMLASLGGVVKPAWPPSVTWTAQLGTRVGKVLWFDIGAAIQVQGQPGLWVPERYGLAVIGTW